MNNEENITIAIAGVIVAVCIVLMVHWASGESACHKRGGAYVQGFLGYECVERK